MNRPSRFELGAVALFVLLAAFGLAYIWIGPPVSGVVRIGVVVPLTGRDSIAGRAMLDGYRHGTSAFGDRVNDHLRIQLVIVDDKSDPGAAAAAARRLVADPYVVGVVGHFSSDETAAALPIYVVAGMPVIMPVATRSDLTRDYPNAFRMSPSNHLQAEEVASFALDSLRASNAVLVIGTGTYSRCLADDIAQAFKQRKEPLLSTYRVGNGTSRFPFLPELAGLHPGLVVFSGDAADAALLIRQSRQYGIQAAFVLSDVSFGSAFPLEMGTAAPDMGDIFVAYGAPPVSVLATRPAFDQYLHSVVQPTRGDAADWAVWAYDAIGVVAGAVAQVPSTGIVPSRDAIAASLAADTTVLFDGSLGPYRFDSFHNNTFGRFYVYRFSSGRYSFPPLTPSDSAPPPERK